MSYTVRDGLKFLYPLVGFHGATRSVGANSFIQMANHALNMIYNYEGYIWSWQHTKEIFVIPTTDTLALRLVTKYPINTVDAFFTSNWDDIENQITPCDCTFDLERVFCGSTCECEIPCARLPLKKIRPQNSLCAGEFKVAGSEIAGQGGLQGRIIHVALKQPVEQLWVTYWKGPVHVTNFDDILPLPDTFMTAFAYFIAGMIVPMYGTMMQQQDLTFTSVARKSLEELKKADNDFPEDMRLVSQSDYPMSEPKTSFNNY